jgi:hypothetical protein
MFFFAKKNQKTFAGAVADSQNNHPTGTKRFLVLFSKKKLPPSVLPAALLLVCSVVWLGVRAKHGIHFASFSDESGHYLGARAIHAGDRLYRDFIDAHGPLSFIVAQACGIILGWAEPLDGRWSIVLLIGVTAISLAASPVFRTLPARLWAAALFLGFVAAPWIVQALNLVSYHVLGGALVAVVLALLILPAWNGARIGPMRAACAGLCLALLCADSYSLAPSALLLIASAALFLRAQTPTREQPSPMLWLGTGFAAGCVVLLTWMLIYADLLGYLVFHFINMQVNYARYTTYGWAAALRSFIPSAAPDKIVQSGAAVACVLSFPILKATFPRPQSPRTISFVAALVTLFIAILMLNFRGGFGFQDGAFVVASFALLALSLAYAAETLGGAKNWCLAWPITAAMFGLLACYEIADRTALSSPGNLTRRQMVGWPHIALAEQDGMPIVRRLHEILRPGERLLALVYDPEAYLYSGFLPIRKFHEYLPWEADYARSPWFGKDRDLCKEVTVRPPPVILYDGWKVWDKYPAAEFMPCIPALLAKGYIADPIPTLFIRRDRWQSPH